MNKVFVILGKENNRKEILKICSSYSLAEKWKKAYLSFDTWEKVEIQDWLVFDSKPAVRDDIDI